MANFTVADHIDNFMKSADEAGARAAIDVPSLVQLAAKLEGSDVVNDLTSGGAALPLSAQQGVVIKGLIDQINTLLASDDVSLNEIQELVDYIKDNRGDIDSLGIAGVAGLQAALDAEAVARQAGDDLIQKRLFYGEYGNSLVRKLRVTHTTPNSQSNQDSMAIFRVIFEQGQSPRSTHSVDFILNKLYNGVYTLDVISSCRSSAYLIGFNFITNTSSEMQLDINFNRRFSQRHSITLLGLYHTTNGERFNFYDPITIEDLQGDTEYINGVGQVDLPKNLDATTGNFDILNCGVANLEDSHSTGNVTHSSNQDLDDPQTSVNLDIGDARFARNQYIKKYGKDDIEVIGGSGSNHIYGLDGQSMRAQTIGQGVTLRLSNYFGSFIGTGAGTYLQSVDCKIGFTIKRPPIVGTIITVTFGIDNAYTTGLIDSNTKGLQCCFRINASNIHQIKILQSDGVNLVDSGWVNSPGILSLVEQNIFECRSTKAGLLEIIRFPQNQNAPETLLAVSRISAFNVNPGYDNRRLFLNLHSESSTTNYYIRFDNIYTIETK